eukprot:GHVN01029269.1.p1 GENE.GHVN01029269.1~~GHVN01029269.1.p1  ORF type:complete len:291 (+),score=20.18 GHVN01029269.1:31-873(+)
MESCSVRDADVWNKGVLHRTLPEVAPLKWASDSTPSTVAPGEFSDSFDQSEGGSVRFFAADLPMGSGSTSSSTAMQRADHLSSGVLSLKRGRDDDSEVCSNRTAKRFRRVFEWSWLHHLHTLKNKISSIVKAGFTLPRDAFNGPLTKPQLSFFPNLASEQMGAKVVFVTDERWGAARNLLSSCSPQSATREGVPVVDGWQTQRRRKPGHEWAVIELAAPGRVCAITVDTRNYDETQITPNISIEAAFLGAEGGRISRVFAMTRLHDRFANKRLFSKRGCN